MKGKLTTSKVEIDNSAIIIGDKKYHFNNKKIAIQRPSE
jgi:hypothetical protein